MRKLSLMTAAAALCLIAAQSQAHAESVYVYTSAEVQITVPDGWGASEADGMVTVSAPDSSVAIVVAVMDVKSAKKGAKKLDKDLAVTFPDLALSKAKKAEVNGLKGYFRRGDATLNGAPVEIGISVLAAPNKKIFMVMALGVVGLYEQHGDAMNAALASISKIRLAMPQEFYDTLGDAQSARVVKGVLAAIDDNDSAALAKYISGDFVYFGKELETRKVKAKAKKKVAKWLKLPDQAWSWHFPETAAFYIARHSPSNGKMWIMWFAVDMDERVGELVLGGVDFITTNEWYEWLESEEGFADDALDHHYND